MLLLFTYRYIENFFNFGSFVLKVVAAVAVVFELVLNLLLLSLNLLIALIDFDIVTRQKKKLCVTPLNWAWKLVVLLTLCFPGRKLEHKYEKFKESLENDVFENYTSDQVQEFKENIPIGHYNKIFNPFEEGEANEDEEQYNEYESKSCCLSFIHWGGKKYPYRHH